MNIPESFYIALCMTVLLLGVVYWFWSQNQYIQRKINLLENIVYELKELCTNQTSFVGPPAELKTTRYSAPAEPVKYNPPVVEQPANNNELHEVLMSELQVDEENTSTQVFKEEHTTELTLEEPFFHPVSDTNDDLQPGGVGSGLKDVDTSDIATTSHVSSLESMTVKELRRLAEQRGIENAADLRKKELIAKLRALAAPPAQSVLDAFNAHEEQSEDLQAISLDE